MSNSNEYNFPLTKCEQCLNDNGIYKEALKKAGLEKGEIRIENAQARKFDTQKIVTDAGIELKIPVEYMNNSSMVELTPNADGSIDNIVVVSNFEITTIAIQEEL